MGLKHKVGDIVTIDSFENLVKKGKYFEDVNYIIFPDHCYIFDSYMMPMCGKSVMVVDCIEYPESDKDQNYYLLEGCNNSYFWSDIMFEDKDKQKFEFIDLVIDF